MYMAIVNILFVCTGNTCRSPMASALFAMKIKERGLSSKLRCTSAGISVESDAEIHENAVVALKELGVKNCRHHAKQFELNCLKKNKLVLTMTERIKQQICSSCTGAFNVKTLAEYVGGEEIPDPYGRGVEEYIEIAKYLNFLLDRLLDKLIKEYRLI